MTTLRMQKKSRVCPIVSTFIVSIVFFIGSIIFLYSQNVQAREKVAVVKEQVKDLRVKNAQLKNALYSSTDSAALVAAAARLGLIKEESPTYITISQKTDQANLETGIQLTRQ